MTASREEGDPPR